MNREQIESKLRPTFEQFMDGAITANELSRWIILYRSTFECTLLQSYKLRLASWLLNWL
jgi:hypothetical protein